MNFIRLIQVNAVVVFIIATVSCKLNEKKTLLYNYKSASLSTIEIPIKEYLNEFGYYPKNKYDLLDFIKKNSMDRDYELFYIISHLNVKPYTFEGNYILYEYGFDGIDDSLKVTYLINKDGRLKEYKKRKGDVVIFNSTFERTYFNSIINNDTLVKPPIKYK